MEDRVERSWTPFWVAGAVSLIAFIAMARLPGSFVTDLVRNRAFDSDQAGWAYRLLAVAAAAQAGYGGFVILQIDRVRRARSEDPKLAALPRAALLRTVTRTGAWLVILTLVYGLAAFLLTGQRGGFWLFALILVLQSAWYVRQVGGIARYLDFQLDPQPERPTGRWNEGPPDYTPPLARGLEPVIPPGP